MGRNLPRLSPLDRRNAPWNDDHPEPDGWCQHCRCAFFGRATEKHKRRVRFEERKYVVHILCANCGNVIRAYLVDETEA